jgi:hypothetical protein
MKRPARRLILGVLAGMGLVVAAVIGDAHRRASATFAFHEREIAAIHARVRARDASRLPVGSDPLDENGWGSYLKSFAAMESLTTEEMEAYDELLEEGEVRDDHLLHGIFQKYLPQIDLLEQGARCRIIEPGYEYEAGPDLPMGWVSGAIRAARLLHGAIDHHHRLGNGAESLRLAVVGLAMSQDLARKGPILCALVQFVCEGHMTEAIREIFEAGHGFARSDLERFQARLEELDLRRMPLSDAWEVEDAYIRTCLIQRDTWTKMNLALAGRADVSPTWRQFFSERIMRAQALNLDAGILVRAKQICSLPPREQIAETSKLNLELERHANPLVTSVMGPLLRAFKAHRTALLGRTLLRISVAIARYQLDHGRDPERLQDLVPAYLREVPICPLTGTTLHYKDGQLWSVGINGVDDGGIPANYGSSDDGGDGDVLWQVRRKP